MKKFLFSIFLFCFINIPAFAISDFQKIDLKEAIDVALKNNIDLKSEKINVQKAKNEIKIANKLSNPSFESFYFLGGPGNNEPRQIGISQDISIAKRLAKKNIAKSQLKLAEKHFEYTTFDLKMDVREAYINLVASKSILNTLEQQKGLQEELLKIANLRSKNKALKDIDSLQAEIALNQLITQINSAKANVEVVLNDFNKIINSNEAIIYDSRDNIFVEENNFEEMLTPNPKMEYPDFENILEKALENRGDLQVAKQKIDLAEKKLTYITRLRLPDIQLNSGYAYMNSRHTSDGEFHSGAYLGARLNNIPLFYNHSPEIQNARLELEQAELNYLSIKNKAIKDIKTSYNKFLIAKDNLNRYEANIIKNSEDLIEVSKKNYQKGLSDMTSIIVMKQSYKSIIIGYTQSLADYYNSWTNFLREINNEQFNIAHCL